MSGIPRRRGRVAACLLLSLLIHLLGLGAYQRWAASHMRQMLRPVRYLPLIVNTDPFRPVPAQLLHELALERLQQDAAPPSPMPELGEMEAFGDWVVAPWERGDVTLSAGEPGSSPGTRGDTLPTLEDLQMDAVRLRAEELEGYARLRVTDADTADAASQARRRARQIVLGAVEAMGGVEALTQVVDMAFQGRFHKSYGTWGKYAQHLPGGARVVFDGHRGCCTSCGWWTCSSAASRSGRTSTATRGCW